MFGFTASICRSCSGTQIASLYQSAFCGLGCQLSKDYSPLARFLVNRDSTYLSLIGFGLAEPSPNVNQRTCCNPFSSSKPIIENEAVLEYSAAVTVCGLAVKVEDDILDESGVRKYAAKWLGGGMSVATDKAVATLNNFGFPTQDVKEVILSQSLLEQSKPDHHEAAEPTAEAFGMIFSHVGSIIDAPHPSLGVLGKSLGKLIYWKDAFDDFENDQKVGKFNVLNSISRQELSESASIAMHDFIKAQEALPFRQNTEILDEVLSLTSSKHDQFAIIDKPEMKKEDKTKRKKTKRKKRDCCCDHCDCCDVMFDCGPGDNGCIDCCPCDF